MTSFAQIVTRPPPPNPTPTVVGTVGVPSNSQSGNGLGIIWLIFIILFFVFIVRKIIKANSVTPATSGNSPMTGLNVPPPIINTVPQNILIKRDEITSLEYQIAAIAARMGFVFPLKLSSTFDAYVQNNKTRQIASLISDAKSLLFSLEDAERDFIQSRTTYENALQVVTQSGSIVLIQGLEKNSRLFECNRAYRFFDSRQMVGFQAGYCRRNQRNGKLD